MFFKSITTLFFQVGDLFQIEKKFIFILVTVGRLAAIAILIGVTFSAFSSDKFDKKKFVNAVVPQNCSSILIDAPISTIHQKNLQDTVSVSLDKRFKDFFIYRIPDRYFGFFEVIVKLFFLKKGHGYGELVVRIKKNGEWYERDFFLSDREYIGSSVKDLNVAAIGKRVLDVGCGANGVLVKDLRKLKVESYGVDLFIMDKSTSYLYQGSFTQMPFFFDNFFDVVFSNFSVFYYHTLNQSLDSEILRQGIEEIVRVLKPGGYFYPLTNPRMARWIEDHFPQLEAHLLGGEKDFFIKK